PPRPPTRVDRPPHTTPASRPPTGGAPLMPTPTPVRAALGLVLVLLVAALALLPPPRSTPSTEAAAPAAGPLHLHWVREEAPPRRPWVRGGAPPRPAWPDQAKLQFDAASPPVASGDTVSLAGPPPDGITACAADTGAVRWHFVTDGPVRFAPAVWGGRVYLV